MDKKLSTFGWIIHILLSLIFVVSSNMIVYFYHYFEKTNNNMFTIFYILELILGLIYISLFFYHFGIFIDNTKEINFTFKKTAIEIIYVIGIMLSGLTIGIIQIITYQSWGFLIIFSIYLLFYSCYLNELIICFKKHLNHYRFIQFRRTI